MLRIKRPYKKIMRRITGPAMFLLALFMLVGCIATTVPDDETTGPAPSVRVTEAPTAAPTEPPLPPVTWRTYPDDREITAANYFVYDLSASCYLVTTCRTDTPIYPASITKLFTAYVALQYIEPDALVTVGDELTLLDPDSSVANLETGHALKAEVLVEAMLLPSGNDAAYAMATAVGRIIAENQSLSAQAAVEVFMEEVNTQAQLVGMTGTHFVTPDGIHDDNHYTTFADLVKLGKLALDNPVIARYAGTPEADEIVSEGVRFTWKNTNPLIRPDSAYYCPYAIGLKTGQTDMAGSCLLSAFECNGKRLLIGVFGATDYETRAADSLQLFNETMGFEYQPTEPPTESETNPTE